MYKVLVYDIYNNVREFPARSKEAGYEIAKRIVIEGLWLHEDEHTDVFYSPNVIVKAKVVED